MLYVHQADLRLHPLFLCKLQLDFVTSVLLWGKSCLLPTQPVHGHLLYHPGFFLSANKSAPMAELISEMPLLEKGMCKLRHYKSV